MEIKEIKAIIDLMKKNSISEFELEHSDFKIKMKRGAVQYVGNEEVPHLNYLPPPSVAQEMRPANVMDSQIAPVNRSSQDEIVKSPMIGSFYTAPSPDAPNYVEIGTEVDPETVVCIIEAMKVMNEIKAETSGVITQMLAENGKPVEFGQPLFKVRPLG